MKLIIGLGNPGKKYEKTWHNVGFLALDELQKSQKFTGFKANAKLKAQICVGKIGGEKIILAKPQTFMNNSGESVGLVCRYFNIPPGGILVIHDDVDLPLGKIRIAADSSAGGHNGVKSIIDLLKTKNFTRIKIGVSTDRMKLMETADYVLEKIGRSDNKQIESSIKKAAEAAICIIEKSSAEAMNLFN